MGNQKNCLPLKSEYQIFNKKIIFRRKKKPLNPVDSYKRPVKEREKIDISQLIEINKKLNVIVCKKNSKNN